MNEGKNAVPAGVYECELIGGVRSIKTNHMGHFVLSLRLKPVDCGVENPCEYFADLPLIFKSGQTFAFYNKDAKKSEARQCTTNDTKEAIAYARKCIPAWAEYCDSLPDACGFVDGVKWFDSVPAGTTVRASLKEPREYNGKLYYDASLYEFKGGRAAVDDEDAFNAEFGSIIKAAGLKVSGAVKKSAAKDSPAPVKAPPKSPMPPKAQEPVKVFTNEDAWNAYEGGECIKNDPKGDRYWSEVKRITGKNPQQLSTFTSEDWERCVEVFSQSF